MNQAHNFKKLTCCQCSDRHAVKVDLVNGYTCDNCGSINFVSEPGLYTSKGAIAFVDGSRSKIYRRALVRLMLIGNNLTRFAADAKSIPCY